MSRHRIFFTFLVASLLCAKRTPCQDFLMNSSGARSEAMGGTFITSSSDVVGALAANPAGLTYLRGRNLNLDTDVIFARGSFSDSVNDGSPLRNSPAAIPYGGFGMPIGHSRFSFGVALLPDLLSQGHWRYVDPPGAAGATYGLQRQESAILAARGVAGLGITLSPRVSAGVTIGADYNSNTLQAPYIFQSQPTLKGLKTLLDVHTNGVGWNTAAGITIRPTKKLEIGFSWKSRTVIDSTGSASGDVGAQFAALGVNAPSQFTYSAGVRSVLPQSVLGSLAWRANSQWLFAFQTDWINWSDSFVTLPVALTHGTNATINGLVGGDALNDFVPLHWKDQYAFTSGLSIISRKPHCFVSASRMPTIRCPAQR